MPRVLQQYGRYLRTIRMVNVPLSQYNFNTLHSMTRCDTMICTKHQQMFRHYHPDVKRPTNTVVLFVPQQEAWVVERMGKFHKILSPVCIFYAFMSCSVDVSVV